VQAEIGDTSLERTTPVIQGLLARSYYATAIGQDDRAAGFQMKAKMVYNNYQKKMGIDQPRVKLPALDVLNRAVLTDLLNVQKPMLPYAARAVIRSQLGMPAETNAPAVMISTNQIVPLVLPPPTNSPATNSAGK
jgi:hypothetical protein